MRFERLDLNLLVALDALLDTQSVSIAAQRIHLSQSAMSSALNRLRDYFRDDLLTSVGRTMVLTPRGKSLTAPVRSALAQIKSTITNPHNFNPEIAQRTVRVVAPEYFVRGGFHEVIRRILLKAPRLHFEIVALRDHAAHQTDDNQIDLLLTLEPFLSEAHCYRLLAQDDYVGMACTRNGAATTQVTASEYFDFSHIDVQSDSSSVGIDNWIRNGIGRSRRVDIVVPSINDLPDFLMGTNRVATLPRRVAKVFAKTLSVKLFELPFESPVIQQFVYWHHTKNLDEGAHWVIDHLCKAWRDIDAAFRTESHCSERLPVTPRQFATSNRQVSFASDLPALIGSVDRVAANE